MKNFLEVYADPIACREALESIAPIQFGMIEGKLWTTTGAIDKFCNPDSIDGLKGGRGAGQRITKGRFSDIPGVEVHRITCPEEARYFAIQLGKPAGVFGAPLDMWGFVQAISPSAALLALIVHRSKNSEKLRYFFGIPNVWGRSAVPMFKQAIEANTPDPSWVLGDPIVKIALPSASIAQRQKAPQEYGLSGLLTQCLAKESNAKEAYDRAVAVMSLAQSEWETAIEDTKAIVRASEIAGRIKQ